MFGIVRKQFKTGANVFFPDVLRLYLTFRLLCGLSGGFFLYYGLFGLGLMHFGNFFSVVPLRLFERIARSGLCKRFEIVVLVAIE